jgi:predicted NBD/HSP70 family sugar kinase
MYIAIDIGGSEIRIASFKSLTHPRPFKRTSVCVNGSYYVDINNIFKAIDELAGINRVDAVGIGTTGVLDKDKSKIINSTSLPNWENEPIREDFENRYKVQIFIENDSVVAALAESQYVYDNSEDFLFIVWGNSIGGAGVRVLNKKIFIESMEPAHLVLYPEGKEICSCGQIGCLHLYCGASGYKDTFDEDMDSLSDAQWKKVTDRFGWAIMNLLVCRNVERVVFGGRIPESRIPRIKQIKKYVNENLKIFTPPKIVKSKLGIDGEIYGGIALIHNRINHSLLS